MKDERIVLALKSVAPGTPLREGLEQILRAKTGGLIVIGDTAKIMEVVEGGFAINTDYSPAYLYELAKMDGAIILSEDGKKILYANAQLVPDPAIPSSETGIRHRTAERVAKQTNALVIAISQRRSVITLYQGNFKYSLSEVSVILNKANQAIATLEKYRSVLDKTLMRLTNLEFDDMVTLLDVAKALQRVEMVLRIEREIERYIWELGSEGRLISMQLEELIANVEDEGLLIIQDYSLLGPEKTPEGILSLIRTWSSEDLLDYSLIVRALGYPGSASILDQPVSPRGYRILDKIPRLPVTVIENLVQTFGNLKNIMGASIEELDDVEGIGEVRARSIKEGLKKLREQTNYTL
ncbi:dna integrity scanning protein disa [Carboxydothermus islandicus]|uniref:DNA integrity scanning protein DisA n=1 Tax=Carboxydothermus islandicus TaxID=661089 RepID=A0A1L8CZS2_9THEO|nr:DNA integrity scanning diadenylate cyclase DisA [Carboxydothermus islandicus]GAV24369.1 dna integrity scanning protein disa [Carboxydothermus islandicus]